MSLLLFFIAPGLLSLGAWAGWRELRIDEGLAGRLFVRASACLAAAIYPAWNLAHLVALEVGGTLLLPGGGFLDIALQIPSVPGRWVVAELWCDTCLLTCGQCAEFLFSPSAILNLLFWALAVHIARAIRVRLAAEDS